MGEVYTADDPELGRKVAIKFLSPEMAASGPGRGTAYARGKAASALNHPHIITVYEVIRAEGRSGHRHGIGGGPCASQFLWQAGGDCTGDPLGPADRAGARGRTSAQHDSSGCEAGEPNGAR